MDALALNHLRNRLHAAERELEQCATAAQHHLNAHSWTNLGTYAAQAAYAAGQVEALKAALDAGGAS